MDKLWKVLTRVFELRKEIYEFLETKGKPQQLLCDEGWVCKLGIVTDIAIRISYEASKPKTTGRRKLHL